MTIYRVFKICFIFFVFLAGASVVFAVNTGFVDSEILLSPVSPNEGESVQLSVSFANHEEDRLTGKISFYNGDILLGSRELTLDSGQTGEFVLEWNAVLGEHSFTAKAENLKLAGSTVTILGPSTEPKEIMIGFKNSNVAERLRQQGGFGVIAAGVIDEIQQFFLPIVESLNEWRASKIEPLEETKERINAEKESVEEGRMKPILVVHSIILVILLFIVSSKTVFFAITVFLMLWVLVKMVKIFKRIIRKDYSQE